MVCVAYGYGGDQSCLLLHSFPYRLSSFDWHCLIWDENVFIKLEVCLLIHTHIGDLTSKEGKKERKEEGKKERKKVATVALHVSSTVRRRQRGIRRIETMNSPADR